MCKRDDSLTALYRALRVFFIQFASDRRHLHIDKIHKKWNGFLLAITNPDFLESELTL